jgi:hypothetical protein
MKLTVIAYNGEVKTKCIFTDEWIGSTGCSKCKYHGKSVKGNAYVNCNKADEMLRVIEALRYKDIKVDNSWFTYQYKDGTDGVEINDLDELKSLFEDFYMKMEPESNINVFLNNSKHIRGKQRNLVLVINMTALITYANSYLIEWNWRSF